MHIWRMKDLPGGIVDYSLKPRIFYEMLFYYIVWQENHSWLLSRDCRSVGKAVERFWEMSNTPVAQRLTKMEKKNTGDKINQIADVHSLYSL